MMQESEVSARLRALPSPAMPDDVLTGIEARLALEQVVVPLTPRHRNRLTWLLAAASVLGFLVLVGSAASPGTQPVAASPIVRAGAVFEPALFADQLRARTTAKAMTRPTNTFADSSSDITACASAVQAYGRVLFLDVGSYGPDAAVVLVTAYPANPDYEEVWVVTPDCGATEASVYRHMIYDVDGSTLKSV